ncbi:1-acyl-sn-glycerol-3-phosphate acyltransferase [uncultured Phycicoccus sp.]|uniref:1-acyl-sn-glycerol-3-phosphate acyltransferase n=1 Tax=uncultured Phycicoccus sp. TaxID=661422 RepID=UPI0026302546|nr:1-acyl-sn-glycerol-3-phosphate acyltransferase [uncultured Phycicoccus sp.]
MRVALANAVLRASGWTAVGDVPRTGILVGAPHTSNWDFVMMLLVMWRGDVTPRVLIKKELFRGPLGWLLRRLGGIPLDRNNPGQVVRELVREARSGEPFLLILAAEGTRTQGEYWKSGFWRIARSAKLPIALAFIDGPSRTTGFGPTITATPDVVADMDLVRAFYRDKRGIHPERRTEPRLREEDRATGDSS